MSDELFVTTEDFIEMTKMELIDLFLLLEDNKLPVKMIDRHLHIDINDPKAKCWLPENKKNLF